MEEEGVGRFCVVFRVSVQIPQLVQVPGQKGREEAFCHSGSAHSATRPQPASPSFLPYSFLIDKGIHPFLSSPPSVPLCCFCLCLFHSIYSPLYFSFKVVGLNFFLNVMDPFGKLARAMESLPKKMHIVKVCFMLRASSIPGWWSLTEDTCPSMPLPYADFPNCSGQASILPRNPNTIPPLNSLRLYLSVCLKSLPFQGEGGISPTFWCLSKHGVGA